MAKYNIPNLYIANRDRAASGGGSDPELEQRVEALETAVDGEGGLTDQVGTLDEQINGDSTATPPVPGIVDEIEALETTVYGDSTATPPVSGLEDRVTALENAPSSADYSTTEHAAGSWIDNRTIYEKTVDCGALPNATSKNIPHGITNIDKVISASGFAYYTDSATLLLPFVHTTASSQVMLSVSSTDIIITTGADQSAYTTTYVTIRYTKSA